ncbi:MAG: hypothetical protein DRJ38_00100 [Thermoprotei archaeon]|nr:MAG: hypothetical protein DRJ38_00100 [Thermoprotei archaeon]
MPGWKIEYYDDASWQPLAGIIEHIVEELNGHKEAVFRLPNTSANRSLVVSDRRVRISFNGTVLFQGILSAVKYSQDYLQCKAYDECIVRMQSKVFTGTYDSTPANTILQAICDEAGVTAGSCPTTSVSVRFDYTICFDAATFLADVLNSDWWTDYDEYGNPRFNIGARGSDKGTLSYISISRRGIDRSKKRTKVIIRGVDKDGNTIYGVAGSGDSVAVFTEKKASDVATLNSLAAKKLAELNKESSGVSVTVKITDGYDLYPGDTVTISNEHLNLSGSYRIWKITKKLAVCAVEVDRAEAVLEKYIKETRQYEDLGIYPVASSQLDNPPGPPSAPTGLTATSEPGAIRLQWNANTEADLDGYIIYRDTSSPASTEYVKTSSTVFVDTNVEVGTTYYYRIKAYDRAGNLSDFSSEVSASPQPLSEGLDYPEGPPATPTGLIATPSIKGIILEWDPNTEADLDHYVIYRGTSSSPTTEYARTASTIFVDNKVDYGTTYYYRIKAVDRVGNASDYSDEVSASPVKVDSLDIAPDAVESEHILEEAVKEAHLQDGAVTPRKLLVSAIFLDGIAFTDNSPSSGYVSWTSGTLYYEGVAYSINSGYTNKKYIYWEKPNTSFSVSDTKPSWAPDRFLIAVNEDGTHTLVWNATLIHGGSIITGTITAQEIKSRSITADRIATNTITSNEVLNISSDKIVISGSVYLSDWRHPSDVTKIDGGQIYTSSITADKLSFPAFDKSSDTLDDIADGSTYRRVKSAALSADGFVLLDETIDGTYGKVLASDIQAGHIKLSTTVKDGRWYDESGVIIDADEGIQIYGGAGVMGLTTRSSKDGDIQCYVGTDGKFYAGGGDVVLDTNGITIYGERIQFRDASSLELSGQIYGSGPALVITTGSGGNLVLNPSGDVMVDGDLEPMGTYNIGSPSNKWNEIYAVSLVVDGQTIGGDLGVSGTLSVDEIKEYTSGANVTFLNSVLPGGNATLDLGSSSAKWKNLYVAGFGDLGSLKIGETEVITSGRVLQNFASIAQTLLPSSDSAYDLGSSSYKWRNGYIITNVIGSGVSLPNGISGELHVGWRKYTSSGDYEISRIAIQPPFHTGGPFRVFARDDPSNAHLALKYGTNKIFEIRHNGLLWLFNTAYLRTILPYSDNSHDLGSSSYRWRNLELSGYGNLGSLRISGTEVITSSRVLQNVSADAGIITSGVFDVARIPNLDASKITSGVFDLARIPSIDWSRMPFDTWSELLDEIGNSVGDYLNLTYLQIGGSTVITSGRSIKNISSVAQAWIPDGNSTRDLGSSSYQWHNLYLGGSLIIGGDTNLYRSGSNILKTDDHFDALSLKVGGTEVVSSSRVLRNISYVDQTLLPLTGGYYNLGSSDLKWNKVYANHFYGTAHYADICFQDLECPICHRKFEVGDQLVLTVLEVTDKEIRCQPAHLECAS